MTHNEDKMKELRKQHNRKYYENTKLKRGMVMPCNICEGRYSYYTKYKHNASKKHQLCLKIMDSMDKINNTDSE